MPAEVVTRSRPSRHRGESDRKPCHRGTWGVATGIGARRWQRYRRSRGARHEPRHVLPEAAAAGPSSRPLRFVPSTVSVLRHSPRPSGFEGLTKPPCFVMPLSKRRIKRRYPEQDVGAALDAAHAAKDGWGRTSVAERAVILNKIADRMEENLGLLALAETWDNGKPIRETTAADLPLAIDHFRYFAGAIRGQEGSLSEIDHDRSEEHTSELQSRFDLVCRLLLEK